MFTKLRFAAKKQSAVVVTEPVTSLNSSCSLLDKVKSSRVQYELSDTGVVLNPYRFLSLKSAFKVRDGVLRLSVHLEVETTPNEKCISM